MVRVRNNSGYIGAQYLPSLTSAGGVSSLPEQQQNKQASLWPLDNVESLYSDAQFSSTALLVHADGSMNADNDTILDSSINNSTITSTGTPIQGTFSPFTQTGWSNYFNGTTDYFSVPNIPFSTNAFTIEGWFMPSTVSTNMNFWGQDNGSGSTAKLILYINGGNLIIETGTISGAVISVAAASYLTPNAWNHIAVVRTSTSAGGTALYINGVSVGTGTMASLATITQPFYVGYIGEAFGVPFSGYISNFRVCNGTAVYTGNFTVPTSPLATTQSSSTNIVAITNAANTTLLTCKSNRFVDTSQTPLTITLTSAPRVIPYSPFAPGFSYGASTVGGSVYLNGSTDYLTTPSSTNFDLAANEFSIELFIYPTSSAAQQTIINKVASATVVGAFDFRLNTNGTITFYLSSASGTTWTNTVSSTTVTCRFNQWNHLVLARVGNVFTAYINGAVAATVTSAITLVYESGVTLNVGANSNGTTKFTGYVSNVRIVKGSSLYNGAFTSPTTPLTAVTNTQLLLSGTNASIFDNTAKNNLITAGSSKLSTTQSKFGSSSIVFNGSTDYIYSSISQYYAFGTGDFTIEFWVYFNSVSGTQTLVDFRPSGTSATANYVNLVLSSGTINYNTNSVTAITGPSVSATTWYHIALVRYNGVTKMYTNGSQSGSNYSDTQSYICGTNRPIFGADGNSQGSNPFNGYIDDLRISRRARYTTTFVAPTDAFQNL